MELSKYCDENEKLWNKIEYEKDEKLINYINQNIDDDLYKIAKSNDSSEVFNNLQLWLLNFYKTQLLDGMKYIEADLDRFEKNLIHSLILGITRDKSNVDLVYDVLKNANIIEKILVYEGEKYEVVTRKFGNINFMKADKSPFYDAEIDEYIKRLGNNVQDGCHELSFFLIKKNKEYKATTAICVKGLENNYYHSFVTYGNTAIDLTANLVMPEEQYCLLHEAKKINCVNYEEYLKEEDDSIKFDESKTLYGLLRNALYKQYVSEND